MHAGNQARQGQYNRGSREHSAARTEGCVVTPGLSIDIECVYARRIGTNAGRVAQRLPMATRPLPNSTDCNCLAVRQAARYITQFYDRCLAAAGLRATQYGVLSRLNRQGPVSINMLAAELVVDRTTLARNIRPLERDGLIAIEPDPFDGRSKILRLTKAGEARFRRAEKHWVEAQKRFERAYGGRRASQLRESLRAVIASDLGPFDTVVAE
jgi:DNA-binding MarR family transcriptional regulator